MKTMKIQLLQVREAIGEKVMSPASVALMMAEEGKADREAMWVLHLNTKNQVIEKELVSLGSLNSSIAHPREIFRKAVINSASCILTVHNHPSGDPTPSAADIQTWDKLVKAGEILDIKVVDNIIITPNGKYYAWTEHPVKAN